MREWALDAPPAAGSDSVSALRLAIQTQQASAVAATNSVKASGAHLSALLASSDSIIASAGDLTASINNLRNAEWSGSLTVSWPSADALNGLTTRLQAITDALASEKSSIAAFVANSTRDLSDIQSKLEPLRVKINAQDITVETSKTRNDADISAIKEAVDAADALHNSLRDHNNTLLTLSPRLDQLSTIATQLSGILNDISISGDKYKSFAAAQESLNQWNDRLGALLTASGGSFVTNTAAYSTSQTVTCEYAFARTKQVKVTLVRSDMMPGTTATSPTSFDLGTMECASPFDVSAGVAFSFITQREYGIQAIPDPPPATTSTNRFVITSDSSFHPVPIAVISARLCRIERKGCYRWCFRRRC